MMSVLFVFMKKPASNMRHSFSKCLLFWWLSQCDSSSLSISSFYIIVVFSPCSFSSSIVNTVVAITLFSLNFCFYFTYKNLSTSSFHSCTYYRYIDWNLFLDFQTDLCAIIRFLAVSNVKCAINIFCVLKLREFSVFMIMRQRTKFTSYQIHHQIQNKRENFFGFRAILISSISSFCYIICLLSQFIVDIFRDVFTYSCINLKM